MSIKRKNSSKYIIEMDPKGFLIIGTLLSCTAIVVFYLGLSFGKAQRNPEELSLSLINDTAQNSIKTDNLKKSSQNVYGSLNSFPENSVDKLTKEYNKIVSQTSITPKESSSKKNIDSSLKTENRYVIQVFATKSKKRAEEIKQSLQDKKYPVYIQSKTVENSLDMIYQIRVGPFDKKNIDQKFEILSKEVKGLGKPKIFQIDP